MNFLAPLFLIGALAVAGPVIYHLVRRTTRERLPFGSLLFLQPSPPRLSQRHRFEHILLLILRCLALALLALSKSCRCLLKELCPFRSEPQPVCPCFSTLQSRLVVLNPFGTR